MCCCDDAAADLADPLPDALLELLAAEVVAGHAFLGELLLDDVLRGDAGVVDARQPERGVAEHAVPADERVLDVAVRAWPRCSSPVTLGGGMMMQNGSRSGFVARLEVALVHPHLVERRLDRCGS